MLENIKLALFDLDGTVYLGDKKIEGAIEALNALSEKIKVAFLTNNSSKSGEVYKRKLSKMGYAKPVDIISSTTACAEFLVNHKKGKSVFPVGNADFCAELTAYGVKLVHDETADIVVLAFDTELTYGKLKVAHNLLMKGAEYIATHPDLVCPTETGSMPDTGSMLELFRASTGRAPDVICGKPYAVMAEAVARRYPFAPSQIMMVGDRLYTDIAFGVNNGYKSVLVLSGETTKEDYEKSKVRATYVLNDITEIK